MSRVRRLPSDPPAAALVAAIALAAALLCASVMPVRAEHVPEITSAITDQTGLLAGDRAAIEDALQQLFDQTGVQLYVLFVDTTAPLSADAFSAAVMDENLGPRDALLMVAVADRTDTIQVGPDLDATVSQVQLDRVRTQVLEPGLAAGDFGAAVIATAEALEPIFPQVAPTAGPTAAPSPTVTPTPPPGGSGGAGGGGIPILPLLLGVPIIGGVIWFVLRRRRGNQQQTAFVREAGVQEELGRKANSLLVETDDALRDAEQELGFAEAEFGEESAADMRAALDGARAELKEAFLIGQRLDDAEPETPEQRRAMIEEIINRCEKARGAVTAQQESMARLRDLEHNAADVLTRLDGSVQALDGRLPATTAADARLQRYAESAIAAVTGNLTAARASIETARQDMAAARTALDAGDRPQAAVATQRAQDRVAEATALLDGVENLASSLDDLAGQLKSELAAATTDVEAARAAVARGQLTPELGATFKQAEEALREARRASDAQRPDVVTALERAIAANALADQVLDSQREAEVTRQRLNDSAAAAVAVAQANVVRARDYINGYRHAQNIGRAARNRLVEAERALEQANRLLQSDPEKALAAARDADLMAIDAYKLATQPAPAYEVPGYQAPPPTYPGTSGGAVGGAVVGGILGGILGSQRSNDPFPGTTPRTTPGQRPPRQGRGSSGTFGGGGGFGSGGFGGGRGSSSGGRSPGRSSGSGRSSSGSW